MYCTAKMSGDAFKIEYNYGYMCLLYACNSYADWYSSSPVDASHFGLSATAGDTSYFDGEYGMAPTTVVVEPSGSNMAALHTNPQQL